MEMFQPLSGSLVVSGNLNPSFKAHNWTRSYKQNFGVGYAGFCYAEILKKVFLVKIFRVAKSSVSYAGFLFIGSGPGLTEGGLAQWSTILS